MAHEPTNGRAPGAAHTLIGWFRSNTLVLASTLVWLAAIGSGLYTLEFGHYREAKWSIIQRRLSDRSYIDNEVAESLSNTVKQYLEAHQAVVSRGADESRLLTLQEQVLRRMQEMMAASPVLTSIHVEDENERILLTVSDPGRLAVQHDFSNSILTRDFEKSFKRSYADIAGRPTGTMRMHVTTARGLPEIEALTTKYRNMMAGFVTVLTLLYLGLIRLVLAPLNRVINSIERRGGARSPIVASPRSRLERAYNILARDATLTRFSKELRDVVASRGVSYVEPLLEQVPRLVMELVERDGAQIWSFTRRSEKDAWRRERVYTLQSPWLEADSIEGELLAMVGEADPADGFAALAGRVVTNRRNGTAGPPFLLDVLDAGLDRVLLFVVRVPPGKSGLTEEERVFFRQMATEVRYALNTVEEQRRLILQEKSKANVSLSRNLGHDLTNIIATSKLDLMTIRNFLSQPPEEVAKSPAKREIFQESLEGLLNNTRFLQEIVNIYRSFSYLQKPKFEEVDLNELTGDVVALYSLSTPREFAIKAQKGDGIPRIRVEPRLLKLALFNLLANATDAIKKMADGAKAGGTIVVSTEWNEARRLVEISVADSGPGIRDAHGNLLSPEGIGEIFRLGYTTKERQEGEGLGLNWVQSIVREFHGGEVHAENRPEGGAKFTMRIPAEHHSAPRNSSDQPAGDTATNDPAKQAV
jgi:signal transduction histidine kinase/predicted metal-dependent enzyme (double-stranded beta helix superfamily)